MFLTRRRAHMPTVAWHVLGNGNTHCQLLTVRQTLVPLRIRVQLLLIHLGYFVRVNRDELILLIPVADETGAPASFNLLKEEAEAAVSLSIDLASVNGEALCDRRLELGDGAGGVLRDVCRRTMASMHDEGTLVHARLGSGYEIPVRDAAGPCGVDVGIRVEDGKEIVPLACITTNGAGLIIIDSSGSLGVRQTGSMATLLRARGA